MAELQVVSALLNKGAELAGMVGQLTRRRTNQAHLDATLRLFDPDIRPQEIRAKQARPEVPRPPWRMFLADLMPNCAMPRSPRHGNWPSRSCAPRPYRPAMTTAVS
jgi:hypothetical protein